MAQWLGINGFQLLYQDHFQVHPESTPFLSKDGNAFANHQVHLPRFQLHNTEDMNFKD
jgi:hypothetical protein